jgi:hypothetical protein
MYCPKCSQPQASDEVQFCARCGLALHTMREIISDGGLAKVKESQAGEDKLSPRQKGVRQGLMLMILSIILIPAYILIAALFPANDRLVESAVSDTPFEKISQAILLTTFMLGLVRALYARFFQPGATALENDNETRTAQLRNPGSYALPTAQSIPVESFGSWRTTGEMAHPESITEHTTSSLRKE